MSQALFGAGTLYTPAPAGSVTPLPGASRLVFVDKAGNDTTGNGTLEKPFLTIAHALSTITDAALTKRYAIIVGPGQYADPFSFKPWIAIAAIAAVGAAIGADPNGEGVVEITCAANTIHFDASWGTAGFAEAWFFALVFANPQTFNEADAAGMQPQLTFGSCLFNGLSAAGPGVTFLGPGTTGTDNALLQNCFTYNGVSFKGWQILWTRACQFLGGTVDVESVVGAAEDTTWLSQGDGVGAALSPTNVSIVSNGAHAGKADLTASAINGTLSLTGAATTFKATPGGVPGTVALAGGAAPPIINGRTAYASYGVVVPPATVIQTSATPLTQTTIVSVAVVATGSPGEAFDLAFACTFQGIVGDAAGTILFGFFVDGGGASYSLATTSPATATNSNFGMVFRLTGLAAGTHTIAAKFTVFGVGTAAKIDTNLSGPGASLTIAQIIGS